MSLLISHCYHDCLVSVARCFIRLQYIFSTMYVSISFQPSDCGGLIEKLQVCSDEELLKVLQSYTSWNFGKCELFHWINVLDRFDGILENATTPSLESPWVLQCDQIENGYVSAIILLECFL